VQVSLLDEPEPGLHLAVRQALQLPGGQAVQEQLQFAAAVDEVGAWIWLGVLGDRVVAVAATGLVVDDDQTASFGCVDAVDVAGEGHRPLGGKVDDQVGLSLSAEGRFNGDGP